MTLIANTYGKGRVRVMRINRVGDHCEARELNVQAMLTGDFARVYTHADNATALCTDTVKNVVNIVAHENLAADTETFCDKVATRLLDNYPQVATVTVTAHAIRWVRMEMAGKPHPHGFVLDSNGQPFARVISTRDGTTVESGVSGFTFMKATGSGWSGYYKDDYTTLAETRDRLCATSMEVTWRWQRAPESYDARNAELLCAMLGVFAGTFSESVQDSLYRMATAALEAVPEVSDIRLACPNKHYLPVNLAPFGLSNDNQVFLPTDEPHGQIECHVGRE